MIILVFCIGKREYEFLKLYLVKPTTPIGRKQNRQTLAAAQAIKAKRQIEIQNGEYGFVSQFKIDTFFLDYYRKMCEDRHGNPESRGNWSNWYSSFKHLERYSLIKPHLRTLPPTGLRALSIFG